jgi:hypothetical protein
LTLDAGLPSARMLSRNFLLGDWSGRYGCDGSRGGGQRTAIRSQVFAGQTVGIKQTEDRIWLVSFMDYDLGYFDDETCRLEPLANPFGPKGSPTSAE